MMKQLKPWRNVKDGKKTNVSIIQISLLLVGIVI